MNDTCIFVFTFWDSFVISIRSCFVVFHRLDRNKFDFLLNPERMGKAAAERQAHRGANNAAHFFGADYFCRVYVMELSFLFSELVGV